MNFAVRAVEEHGLRMVAAHQSRVKPVKESCEGEPVEELKDGKPAAEFCRKRPPGDTVSQHVPEGVKMGIKGRGASSAPNFDSVSIPKEIGLIFLAAHGAAPACNDGSQSSEEKRTEVRKNLNVN